MLSYIITFVLGFVFCKWMPDLRNRAFAAFMAYFHKTVDPKYEAFKADAYRTIKDIKSQVPDKPIRILEIGVGTGTNFQFFPEGCHLVVVDPNPHFTKYYNENRAKFPQIKSEEFIVATGEEMDMVPDNSIDVVVISLVLCSVANTKQVLKQIIRVLVPGGKFYYVEHIKEWDSEHHSRKQLCQDWLTWTGVWPALLDGCELNRLTHEDIDAAGFSKVESEKKHAPINHPIFKVVNSHLVGVATK